MTSRTWHDITALPDLAHSSVEAGPVRRRRPVYRDLLPPCNAACPAGENVQLWLADLRNGQEEAAWRTIVADNPFPAIHGRVCYHPCESRCNRSELDSPVSIHAVERYLGDRALLEGWGFPPAAAPLTGKRVLVIGGGPSGLSAAYHLARRGHEVEVRDAGDRPGGMMRNGIPAYRLPRDVLDAEVERLGSVGVHVTTGYRVDDLEAERRDGGFDAVFVAVGAHLSKRVDIPAADATRIVDALGLLERVAAGERPVIGRRVAVYGGGNTAMDAARVARRLGAEETVVVYRRTRAQMPAHVDEVEEAEREGVQLTWLRTITALEGPDLRVEVMELDGDGIPQPTGRFETLAADTVVLAVGQDADTDFLRRVSGVELGADGTVEVGTDLQTGAPGVFAGGDMVPSERTVTVGVGHGKKAAREIDAWLQGRPPKSPRPGPVVGFDDLHLWYFGDDARRPQHELDLPTRLRTFAEVVEGLTPAASRFEAGRCLSCGNCFECDGCLGACPEGAVVKLGVGRRYRFDLTRCTGCGICVFQCPVNAIGLVPEGDDEAAARHGESPTQALDGRRRSEFDGETQ